MPSSPTTDLSAATQREPDKLTGCVAGALTVVGFAVIHDLWITDIWFNIVPMVVSGAVCGLSIVWGYHEAVAAHTTMRWWVYNGILATLLVALGGVSFLVLDPRFTMAEAMVMDDALSELIPPALPLMIATIATGTFILWVGFGRRRRAVIPLLVTQILLVFLVGHNLAILGLVEMSSGLLTVTLEFVGLTVFLTGGYAAGAILLGMVRRDQS